MNKPLSLILWLAVALAGAFAYVTLALKPDTTRSRTP